MRLFQIIRTFSYYQLAEFLPPTLWFKLLAVLFFWQKKADKKLNRGERLRLALESLGPVYIKLGQFMSVRRDLLPSDVADSLTQLQDAVPPMLWAEVEPLIEQGLDSPILDNFQSVEPEAIAAASIAQVHRAITTEGKKCVIKVLRPNLAVTIQKDMRLAAKLAKYLNKLSDEVERLRLPEIVRDYDTVIHDELDLSREAANAAQIKRNFSGSTLIYVPEIDWSRTRETILTMEEISGVPIGNIAELKSLNVDMKKLAERGTEVFFTQVFRDNFFHADMHPGNIFVDVSHPQDPSYIAVDFGIVGSLPESDQLFLAETLLAFFNHDYANLAQSYIAAGWVDDGVDAAQLESAFRTILEPYLGKPISEVSLAEILLKLFRVSSRFGMVVQPQMVLLDKTMLYIEGLGKQLYPDLDLWNTAKPFIEKWLKSRVGLTGFIQKSKENFPEFAAVLPDMPIQFYRTLEKAATGRLGINTQNKALEKKLQQIERNQKKMAHRILSASGLISAVLLFGQNQLWLSAGVLTFSILWVFKK